MITVTRANLYAGLRAVLPFTSPDEYRGALQHIYLEIHANALHLVTTNGVSLAWAVIEGRNAGAERSFLLGYSAAEEMLKSLKPKRTEGHQELAVTIGSPLDPKEQPAILISGLEIPPYYAAPGKFPPFRQIVPDRQMGRETTGIGLLGMSPALLAAAGQAADNFAWTPGATSLDKKEHAVRPFAITMPDSPIGPVRLDYAVPDRGALVVILMPMRI